MQTRGSTGRRAPGISDRIVVTDDPRSERTGGADQPDPDEHADDLHRVIGALDAGPVDIFATSGGAVNALALVAKHREQVRTLVAHEPPAAAIAPDREAALAAAADVHETYMRDGLGGDGRSSSRWSAWPAPCPPTSRRASTPTRPTDPGRRV